MSKTKKVVKKVTAKKVAKGKKRCSRCEKVLPLADFAKLSSAKDGKLGHCRLCESVYKVIRRLAGQ